MAKSGTVSASGVSRFLSRAGFRNHYDFRAEQVGSRDSSTVRVYGGDVEGLQRALEGNGYRTSVHRSTGELRVHGRFK